MIVMSSAGELHLYIITSTLNIFIARLGVNVQRRPFLWLVGPLFKIWASDASLLSVSIQILGAMEVPNLVTRWWRTENGHGKGWYRWPYNLAVSFAGKINYYHLFRFPGHQYIPWPCECHNQTEGNYKSMTTWQSWPLPDHSMGVHMPKKNMRMIMDDHGLENENGDDHGWTLMTTMRITHKNQTRI